MDSRWHLGCSVFLLAPFSEAPSPGAPERPTGGSPAIAVRTANVDGANLQYLSAGRGPAIVLLHGYAETSRMWRPIIPLLAKNFTVIAPDLPGIGDSGIPTDGLDMKTAAIRIHDLAKSLGIQKACVVGHDIGRFDVNEMPGVDEADRRVGPIFAEPVRPFDGDDRIATAPHKP